MLATQQIFLIASLLCFLTLLTLVSVSSDGVRGMRALVAATALGMAGNALYAFGRELPPVLAYEAANITYAAAGAALVAGYRRLAGQAARALALSGAVCGFGVLIAVFHYRFDSFVARSALVSVFQAAVCVDIARTVVRCRAWWRPSVYPPCFILSMCALVALGHAARMAWLVAAPQTPTSLLQPSPLSIGFLTAVSLALPALAMGSLLIAHRQIVRRAEHASNHDFLTGAASRRAFFEIGAREIARSARNGKSLALLLIDLDHFKSINDTLGHQGGDGALQTVADSAQTILRGVDCLARLGGDEFALLLPDTNLHGAAAVGDKLRHVVRHAASTLQPPAALTLSLGVTVVVPGEDLNAAIARADAALYEAKSAGRNRVVVRAPMMRMAAGTRA